MEAQILLDLKSVAKDKRQSTWSSDVPGLMPGIYVEDFAERPSVGRIEHVALAASHAWQIESSPVKVTYSPSKLRNRGSDIMSLMMQLKGHTRLMQGSRSCCLDTGSMCLVDNFQDFHLDVADTSSRLLVLQMPRPAVLQQYPFVEDMTALKFSAEDPGAQILSMTLVKVLASASKLAFSQQEIALSSIIHLLGLFGQPTDDEIAPKSWRVRRALTYIETNLSDPDLKAQSVADEQSISRRQLDRMVQEETGITLSGHIWERRLIHAAAQLQSTAYRDHTITQIAMATGFEDASHFTRAFKKRFDTSPKSWRNNVASESPALPK